MEDLGRCENCGKLVPEIELTSLEIDDPFDIVEELWCQNCYDEGEINGIGNSLKTSSAKGN